MLPPAVRRSLDARNDDDDPTTTASPSTLVSSSPTSLTPSAVHPAQEPNEQSSDQQSPAAKSATMSAGSPDDVDMIGFQKPPHLPEDGESKEPKYGSEGLSRFELELEFVQAMANPNYLAHLANSTNPPYFSDPAMINYLSYLQYWSHPSYAKYLHYPGPTLKNLELLQEEAFRKDIGRPEVVARMIQEGVAAGLRGPGYDGAVQGENGQGQTQTQSASGQEAPNPSQNLPAQSQGSA